MKFLNIILQTLEFVVVQSIFTVLIESQNQFKGFLDL